MKQLSEKDLYCIEPIMPKDMVSGEPYMIAYYGPNKSDLFKDGRQSFSYLIYDSTTPRYIVCRSFSNSYKSIGDIYNTITYYPLLTNHFFTFVDYQNLALERTKSIRGELMAKTFKS